jgi:uncharacterized membrane protein YgcG
MNATPVVNIHVITNKNEFGSNVTVYNHSNASTQTQGVDLSGEIIDNTVNNITYSYINNSKLWNFTASEFGIKSAVMNYVSATDSIIMDSKAYYADIATSTITQVSYIHNSTINGSTLINSTVKNESRLIDNVTLINSTVTDGTILEDVTLSNTFVDPSFIANSQISEGTSRVIDSRIRDSTINNSYIYNVSYGDVSTSQFMIDDSQITNCTIETYNHSGNLTNVSVANAVLTGDSDRNNCRLYSGSVTVNQSGTLFTYSVASYTATPLVADIWNYTPNITPTNPLGDSLVDDGTITGPYLTFNISIYDPNLASTLADYVNTSWEVEWVLSDGNQQNNLSLDNNVSNGSSSINVGVLSYDGTTYNGSNLNITYTTLDKFGNINSTTIRNITYIYNESYNPSSECSVNSDCGSATISYYCNSTGNDYWKNVTTPSCLSGSCSNISVYTLQESCNHICTTSGSDYCDYTECSDGVDNDNDGKIDYGNDSQCSSFTDNSESSSNNNGGGSSGGGGGGSRGYPSYCTNGKKDFQK